MGFFTFLRVFMSNFEAFYLRRYQWYIHEASLIFFRILWRAIFISSSFALVLIFTEIIEKIWNMAPFELFFYTFYQAFFSANDKAVGLDPKQYENARKTLSLIYLLFELFLVIANGLLAEISHLNSLNTRFLKAKFEKKLELYFFLPKIKINRISSIMIDDWRLKLIQSSIMIHDWNWSIINRQSWLKIQSLVFNHQSDWFFANTGINAWCKVILKGTEHHFRCI